MISPTPRTVKSELTGKSFQITDVSGQSVNFTFPDEFKNWPRRGMEGIVIPVTCHHPQHGEIPSIMKCFDHRLPERGSRQEYLVQLGLVGIHDWLYEGVPYLWMNREVAGVPIYGHVAKQVGNALAGDDFRIVRDSDAYDRFTIEQRLELAAQLCVAVAGLERIGIVHGDLSPANIIIGRNASSVRCSIIDYDGFYSESVPMLPRMHEDVAVRPLGSPGYQHPTLMSRLARDKDNVDQTLYVKNDRFSLAVICFELVTWQYELFDQHDAMELIDLDELINGRLVMPIALSEKWPEGYKLLKQCAETDDPSDLPSPEDWLGLLGFPMNLEPLQLDFWKGLPSLRISRRLGNQQEKVVREVEFQKDGCSSGSLELIQSELRDIQYKYSIKDGQCEKLELTVLWDYPVLIDRGRKTMRHASVRKGPISIEPGMKVLTNGWVFSFTDKESAAC